jgi:glycosyltransferase involved in cell wall biosynthesis
MGSSERLPKALYLLTHSPFPPTSGGSKRAAAIASVLGTSYDMTILAADAPNDTVPGWNAAVARFRARRHSPPQLTRDALEGIARGEHVVQVRSLRVDMPGVVAAWLRSVRPELVILDRPLLTPYIEVAHRAGAKVVIDVNERLGRVAWGLARSPYSPWRQRLRFLIDAIAVLDRMERRAYPDADQLWAASREEKASLASVADPARAFVIPNAVAVPSVSPAPFPVHAVAFLGWYRYPPNEAAALELMKSIMPAIRSAGGPNQLVLIGSEPTAAMASMAETTHDVTITGHVDDVLAPLTQAGVLVVPLRAGGGTRLKILEAAAAGIPVVSTRLGIEGLSMIPGRDVLVAETAREFAEQVALITNDAEFRARLVQSAYEVVRKENSADAVAASIRGALARL